MPKFCLKLTRHFLVQELVLDKNRLNASLILDFGPLKPSGWQGYWVDGERQLDGDYYTNQVLGADLMWKKLSERWKQFFV